MPSRKIRLQLYADECFPVPTVVYLRSKGVSIVHASSFNYLNKSDKFHLKVSKNLGKILITLDRDFTFNWKDVKSHPGVILISTGSRGYQAINDICYKGLTRITLNFTKDSLLRITKTKVIKLKNDKKFERIL